ncbi:MAG: hypothetical protein KJ614_10620 [Gammaproteobacteria bacterium]|uniref:hypothetical protein n=1 Tax=Rhodoferax sp. TaxID=50421 RepID=UPI00181843BA|nr:hypothetical protein [Rhodoferax sp.]MBU3899364.1 hypothetical protein [Gammaproteobacteria bacterium]MBA3058387.1 hypothetical protein [Rhodoferax sp.]MBU3997604.1 hypothetical protein [Gammaproteobacteria bacterium]MBU4080619.1 hypothetical protein [Gammaproteobacteria bacterium]MBU4113600.1 hypothetical protein [Gammaproteobacteria bacterium]
MKHYKAQHWLLLLSLLANLACAQPVSFGLIGDMPYSAWERRNLPALLADMDREGLAFVVHDGDIKGGGSVCSDAVLRDVLKVFQASKTPLIYVPGDNEWTDCHRSSNGGYDPLERLQKLRALFFAGDASLGQRAMPLQRQSRDPAFASYRENVRWEAGGALFVGLNLPGSENNFHGTTRRGGPSPEFIARSAANRVWLAQAFEHARSEQLAGILIVIQGNPDFDGANQGRAQPGYAAFLTQLREQTQAFAGQVVLVHGDTHWQRIDQPLRDPVSGQVISNFTRVETYGYPFFGWVKASVDATDPQVFRFSPRTWRAAQAQP